MISVLLLCSICRRNVLADIIKSTLMLAIDILEALTQSLAIATEIAKDTLQQKNITKNFNGSEFVFKGELPVNEYREETDVEEKFSLIDQLIENLKIVVSVDMTLSLTFTFFFLFLLIRLRNIRQNLKSAKSFQKKKHIKFAKNK